MNENKEKTAGNLANSVVEGYDYSVAVRMSGRAGAYSPTGGKGNAFEVMYSDKKNLSNLLKPDTTTTLTNAQYIFRRRTSIGENLCLYNRRRQHGTDVA